MPGPDHVSTDAAFGFIPWGPVLRAQLYSIVTSNAVAVYRGMLMEAVGTAYLTPKSGYLQGAISLRRPVRTGRSSVPFSLFSTTI